MGLIEIFANAWPFAVIIGVCLFVVVLLFREPVIRRPTRVMSFGPPMSPPVEYRPPMRRHTDRNLRLNHLWLRKLQMDDERMAIFIEACELYKVDPDECGFERDYVEECFLSMNTGMTPGITQIRLDEYRQRQETEWQDK